MARDFPNTSGNVLSAAIVQTIVTDLTIACWAKFDAAPASGQDSVVYIGSGGSNGYGLQVTPAPMKLRALRGGTEVGPTGATTVTTNVWHHCALTRTASGAWLVYLDGIQDASDATGSAGTPTGNTWYGGSSSSADLMDGQLAEVGIWNVGLNASEIMSLAKGTSPRLVRPGSLQQYLPLSGTGSPERDRSGKGFHATITGTVPAAVSHPPMRPSVLREGGRALPPFTGVYIDVATIPLNLECVVEEEFPVVYFNLQASTTAEGFLIGFDSPIAHLATFNAPYEDPLDEDGGWAKLDTSSLNQMRKLDDGGGWGIAQSAGTGNAHVYWTQASFGHDTEVMFQPWDMPAGSFCYLWLCVQNEGTTTPSGYRLEIEFVSGSGDQWRLQKVVAGVVTTLATQAWSTGNADWAILRRVGDTLSAYEAYWTWDEELEIDADYPNLNDDYVWMTYPPNPEVGVFKYEIYDPVVSTTDSTIISEGRVGFGVNHIGGVRNFYAGDAYSVKEDADEIYVNIGIRGYEGIEGEPSFFTFDTPESLDQWEIYWQDYSVDDLESPQSHAVISNIVAVDGDASLRLRMDGDYPPSEFHMIWPDFVNGGDNTLDYWMTYAFYIESWASIDQGGLGGGFPLPGIMYATRIRSIRNIGVSAPYLQPLSETSGQVNFSGSSITVAEKDWHTVRFRWRQTGTQRVVKVYVNESVLYDATIADTFGISPPMGMGMGQENDDTDGVVYIDALTWSPGAEPTAPSVTTETGLGTSTEQWLRIRDNINGLSSYNSIELWELDEVDENGVPEAWLYAEIYIPQSYLDQMPDNEASAIFLETDAAQFYVRNSFGTNPQRLSCFIYGTSGVSEKILVQPLQGNRWYRIEVHYLANTLTEVWIDNVLHSFPLPHPGSVNDYTGYWTAAQAGVRRFNAHKSQYICMVRVRQSRMG